MREHLSSIDSVSILSTVHHTIASHLQIYRIVLHLHLKLNINQHSRYYFKRAMAFANAANCSIVSASPRTLGAMFTDSKLRVNQSLMSSDFP